MAQRTAGHLAARRDIADQLDAARVGRLRGIYSLICPFDPVDHGRERHVPGQAGSAIVVNGAHRRADLIVRIGRDVFHQKIDPARIALQNANDLQSAVTDVDFGQFRRFDGLRVTEMRGDVFGQDA